ncbi:MAG: sigma-70 family RNA polymerase sigma factor, partial [Deltaproteobacteria bacterium]|nr:sigma-70 family RNA polymerase sigma factor [Nannocystaceae bacterium]
MTAHVRRRGDPAELSFEPDLERLYEQFHPFVRSALRKHYVDPEDLEDMTHEVFLVLLRRVDEASRTPSIGAWLYQIARRVAANQHRGDRRRTRKHDELQAAADSAAHDAVDPQERYARAEAWAFVREFLESLDAEACAVFVMSEIEGLRGAEIAERLRLSLPMTYARIRTVRARFARRVARGRRGMFAGLWWAYERPALAVLAAAMTTSRRLKLAVVAVLFALVGLLTLRGGGGDDAPEGGTSAHASEQSDERRRAARADDPEHDASLRAPRPTGAFGGVVVDLGGAPIASAIVCGDRTNASDHLLTSPPTCVRSDARGRFRIDGTLLQAHTLEAMATGFVPGRFHGRPTTDVRIVLHPGGAALSGVVIDVHGGPVEGAWVAIENRSEATLGATVTTDEAGAFSLWVAEGPVSLAAGASGYATSFRPTLAPGRDVQIELGAESVLAGIVVDGESGEPVADVRVSALLQEGTENYANRGGLAFSDAEGRWEIRGLAPDEYIVDAAADRGWGRADEAIELGIGDVRDGIRIELMAGAAIVGRIVDAETGAPCGDGLAITLDRAQNVTREDRVDADGRVAVRPLTGGAIYRVTAACRGYESRELEIDLRGGPAEPVEWALARGSELEVRIVDAEGEPLQDWRVDVAKQGSEPFRGPNQFGEPTTDAEGKVVFSGVSAGEYRVIAQGPGHPTVALEDVAVGTTRTAIELRAGVGVAITGTVVDAAGDPLAGAYVAVQRTGQGTRFLPTYWSPDVNVEPVGEGGPYHAITDAAGEFRFASIGRGEYGVWVVPDGAAVVYQRPDYPTGVAARVPGEPHRSISVADRPLALTLRVGSLSSISGTVRGEDGDVVMDARVFAVREHEPGGVDPRGRPRLSDREGRYSLDGLEAGMYTMIVYRPGGGVVRRTGVAAGSRGVDLELPRVGRISGTVRGSDGSVVKAFSLHVHSARRYDRPPFPA